MAGTATIRVVIVDDHPIFRDGLAILLGRQTGIEVVGVAEDGRAALAICREQQPDVVLVDLRMEGLDGLDVVGSLTRELPGTRSIVLSGFDADEDVYRAMRAGASGYLLKQSSPEELSNAIQRVQRGDKCIPPALAQKLANHLTRPHLTARQEEVLRLIADGLNNQEIAERLSIVEGTVKAHVKSILAKLGARDRTQAVSVALDRGLVRR